MQFNKKNLNNKSSLVRRLLLLSIYHAQSGHPGGSLSIADILTCLYFEEMKIESPNDPERDRFILSKGHGCPALYAVLALKGFIPKKELWNLRKTNALLQGHPEVGVPGIEAAGVFLGRWAF